MDKQYYQKTDTTPPSPTNHPLHPPKFPEKQLRSHNPHNTIHSKLHSFITENQPTSEILKLTYLYLPETLLIESLKYLQHIPKLYIPHTNTKPPTYNIAPKYTYITNYEYHNLELWIIKHHHPWLIIYNI
jgi:hypothetical protein